MSDTVAPEPSAIPYRGLIAALAISSTVMVTIDASIANVALPHMQASLSAAPDTITWVVTSYLIASAVAIPLTGWLDDLLGRRTLILMALGGFTLASIFCGIATSLEEIVVFRLVQGAFGAFIVPLAQATIADLYPRDRLPRIMSYFGMGVQVGWISGPLLGGVLTDVMNWRWVFYINAPIGLIALGGFWAFLPKRQKTARPFDMFGFAFLSLGVIALQLVLDRGQQLDWFDSPEIRIEIILAVVSFLVLAIHVSSATSAVLDRSLLLNRTFICGIIFMGLHGGLLSSTMALAPQMLQHVFDYPSIAAGMAMAPRGVGAVLGAWLAGRLSGHLDPRLALGGSFVISSIALYWMAGSTPNMDITLLITSGLLQGVGAGATFVPLNSMAFADVDRSKMAEASGLFFFMRNMIGAIFVSIMTASLARGIQTNHADIAGRMPTTLPDFGHVLGQIGGSADAIAIRLLNAEATRQAMMIAYLNDYLLLSIAALAFLPLLLLMRPYRTKSSAAKSETDAVDPLLAAEA